MNKSIFTPIFGLAFIATSTLSFAQEMSLSKAYERKNLFSSFALAKSDSVEQQAACDAAEKKLIEIQQNEIQFNRDTEFKAARSECEIKFEGVSSDAKHRYLAVKAVAYKSYRGLSSMTLNYFFVVMNTSDQKVAGVALHKQLSF